MFYGISRKELNEDGFADQGYNRTFSICSFEGLRQDRIEGLMNEEAATAPKKAMTEWVQCRVRVPKKGNDRNGLQRRF